MNRKVPTEIVISLANHYLSKGVAKGYLAPELISDKYRNGVKSTIRRHLRNNVPEHVVAKAIDLAYEDPWMAKTNIYFSAFVYAIEKHLYITMSELNCKLSTPIIVKGKSLDEKVWGYFINDIYIRPANSPLYSKVIIEMFRRMKFRNKKDKWKTEFDEYFNDSVLKKEWGFLYI